MGALGYAVAVGGTSVWRVVVGWCVAMVLWATTLYGVHDVALTMFGHRDVCTVAQVEAVRGKSATPRYVVTADCPGAGRQQTRQVRKFTDVDWPSV
jgi:hypothetical protein